MAFKKNTPNYKNLEHDIYYMHSFPSELWEKLEAYIPRIVNNSNQLKAIVNSLNALLLLTQSTIWGWDFLIEDLSNTFHEIKKEGQTKFYLYLGTITTIAEYEHANIDELNELLEEYNIGHLLKKNTLKTII